MVIIYVVLFVVIIFGCSKTTILNESHPVWKKRDTKESRTFTPKDTTDTARHEITFGPTIIGWEVVDVESGL